VSWKKPRKSNCPEDGKPWRDLEKDKLNLKPISIKDIKEASRLAGYKLTDYPELVDKLKKKEEAIS